MLCIWYLIVDNTIIIQLWLRLRLGWSSLTVVHRFFCMIGWVVLNTGSFLRSQSGLMEQDLARWNRKCHGVWSCIYLEKTCGPFCNCNALWQQGRSPMEMACFWPGLRMKCGGALDEVPARSLLVWWKLLYGQVGIPCMKWSIITYWRRVLVFGYCRWSKHGAGWEILERIRSLVGESKELLTIVFCQW